MIEFLLLIGGILLCFGFKWAIKNNDYFAKRNLPFIKPYFIVGNFGGMSMSKYSLSEFVQIMYNSIPTAKIVGAFEFLRPLYILRDPEVIKQMAVKDFEHFEDHRSVIDEQIDVLFGNSLLMLKGEKWREMRAALSPAFTGSKMRLMFDLITDCGYQMAEYFKKEAAAGKHQDHEMKELFSRYANDVIASAAFGFTVNSFENENNEFFTTGKKILNFSSVTAVVKIILVKLFPSLMKALDISVIDASATRYFKSIVLEAMEYRQKNNIVRPDMINIMMKLKAGNNAETVLQELTDARESIATVEESSIGKVPVKRHWSDTDLIAQCLLFFLAGFDTSSTALSFTAHELALNPEVQDKLYAEIVETNTQLNGKKLTYDDIQKMKYLDMVVTEGLRYWPPAPVTDRLCVKDYEYDDGEMKFKMEKGLAFWIPIYGLHHDPQYFPNPSKFDPERFSEENKANIVSGTYLPFGIGPRNCIGSRFALMAVKAVLYYLILSFKIEPNTKTQIPLKLKRSPEPIASEKGIHLRLTPR